MPGRTTPRQTKASRTPRQMSRRKRCHRTRSLRRAKSSRRACSCSSRSRSRYNPREPLDAESKHAVSLTSRVCLQQAEAPQMSVLEFGKGQYTSPGDSATLDVVCYIRRGGTVGEALNAVTGDSCCDVAVVTLQALPPVLSCLRELNVNLWHTCLFRLCLRSEFARASRTDVAVVHTSSSSGSGAKPCACDSRAGGRVGGLRTHLHGGVCRTRHPARIGG